jgi:hypothetical protein
MGRVGGGGEGGQAEFCDTNMNPDNNSIGFADVTFSAMTNCTSEMETERAVVLCLPADKRL